jgi:predicted  nucleic acid-binding Zn-ribbon protein
MLGTFEVTSPWQSAVKCPNCSKFYEASRSRIPASCERCGCPMDEGKGLAFANRNADLIASGKPVIGPKKDEAVRASIATIADEDGD